MKNVPILVSIFFAFLILPISGLSAQSSDLPKMMFVDVQYGLTSYAEPTTDSTIIGAFLHGEGLLITERSGEQDTINGITDYWYRTVDAYTRYDKSQWESWIFGGFLSDKTPADVPIILGRWEEKNYGDPIRIYIFEQYEKHWAMGGWEEKYGSYWEDGGTWDLDGDILTLGETHFGHHLPDEDDWHTYDVRITVIDKNNIVFTFSSGNSVELVRCTHFFATE